MELYGKSACKGEDCGFQNWEWSKILASQERAKKVPGEKANKDIPCREESPAPCGTSVQLRIDTGKDYGYILSALFIFVCLNTKPHLIFIMIC